MEPRYLSVAEPDPCLKDVGLRRYSDIMRRDPYKTVFLERETGTEGYQKEVPNDFTPLNANPKLP